ncbi:MAG: glycosyltransferase family 9 protein [Candidatus Binataceae bacterium]
MSVDFKHSRVMRSLWWALLLNPFDAMVRSNSSHGNSVLAIRLDATGDFVLWLSAAEQLRRVYPGARITLLANTLWSSMARRLPYFDEVWSVNRRSFVINPIYRYRLLRRIARAGFSVALNPTYARDFFWGDAVIRTCGAPQRIGFRGGLDNMSGWLRNLSSHWYTSIVDSDTQTEFARHVEFIRALGVSAFEGGVGRLDGEVERLTTAPSKSFYILCPGAGHHLRRWPAAHFATIADRIFEYIGLWGMICGGAGDTELAGEIARSSRAPLIDQTGRTTFERLVELIRDAALVVSNETGPVHIAATVSTPSICITGGGHFGRFVPYEPEMVKCGVAPDVVFAKMSCFGCDWQCIYNTSSQGPAPCLVNVTVEAVWQKIRELLEREYAFENQNSLRSTKNRLVKEVFKGIQAENHRPLHAMDYIKHNNADPNLSSRDRLRRRHRPES